MIVADKHLVIAHWVDLVVDILLLKRLPDTTHL